MMEKTLVLVKPDGVQRQIVGKITERFENVGLKIIGMKMQHINEEFAKKHYKSHTEKDFYKFLEEFITSGPVIAMVIGGLHAIETVRKIVGDTEPKSALPGTIRGDLAHQSYDYTNKKGISIKNLVHASGNKEEAEYEINLWFKPKEIYNYKTLNETHNF